MHRWKELALVAAVLLAGPYRRLALEERIAADQAWAARQGSEAS